MPFYKQLRFSLRGLLIFLTIVGLLAGALTWWFREPPPTWRTVDEILTWYDVEADQIVGSLPDRTLHYTSTASPWLYYESSTFVQTNDPTAFPNLPQRIDVPEGYDLFVLYLRTPENQHAAMAWLRPRTTDTRN